MPVSGRGRVRYGGNTPCIEAEAGERRLIIDAGTGIRPVDETLVGEGLGVILPEDEPRRPRVIYPKGNRPRLK